MSTTPPLHIVILAAGIGSRMRSALPKVLHELGGKPLLEWVIQAALSLCPEAIYVIYGHEGDKLKAQFKHYSLQWIHQAEQLGTGHALGKALPHIPSPAQVLVLAGDVPLLQATTLKSLLAKTQLTSQQDGLGLLLSELDSPYGYGRVIRNAAQEIIDIVEEKDASPEQKNIREIYTGTCLGTASVFNKLIPLLKTNNAQQEYYLTQVISLAAQQNIPIHAHTLTDPLETQGINTRAQLASLERHWQWKQALKLMEEGVTLADPARIDIRGTLYAEPDVFIDVNTVFEGEVTLKKGCRIGPHCVLKNVTIEEQAMVFSHCMIEGAVVGAGSQVGPFARLRPGTVLETYCKVGNFVETKNAQFGRNSKANHLSYLGDVLVGEQVNIGAGTITCNYDGVNKHQTRIESGAFIGSGTQLVAPVCVGANATIGAGTTLRADAPENALTLTAREQKTLKNWKKPTKK